MLKITYGELNTPHLMPALQKLDQYSNMPLSVAYKVIRAKDKLQVEMNRFIALSLKLDEEFGKKDDKGQLVRMPPNVGPVQHETEEKRIEHDKKWAELIEVEIELKIEKLPAQFLEGARLSPAELRAISFMVDVPDDVATPVAPPQLKSVKSSSTGKKK